MTKPGQPVSETLTSVWTRSMPLHVAGTVLVTVPKGSDFKFELVAILMCISFILTLTPGRDARIVRLCAYAVTLVICMATFFADFAITYHIKISLIKGLSTLGLATASLDGPGESILYVT